MLAKDQAGDLCAVLSRRTPIGRRGHHCFEPCEVCSLKAWVGEIYGAIYHGYPDLRISKRFCPKFIQSWNGTGDTQGIRFAHCLAEGAHVVQENRLVIKRV
jgi:hypothetical protein